jgi:murein DD-endopeptidase MepM/ murein hydrolase activator NlpD
VVSNNRVFPIVGWSGKVNNHWGTSERGGSDIFGVRGAAVVAVCGGYVQYAGYDPVGGYNVLIAGTDGLTYYYAHLDKRPSVWTGQNVNTGAYLGPLGDSGNAAGTGVHLHIGIGYGINNGSGPSGGCGKNFDAVGLLQSLVGSQVDDGEDENVIAELQARVQALEADQARLNEELAAEKSWSGATVENILKPSAHELHGALQGSFTKTKRETVERVRDRLAEWAG